MCPFCGNTDMMSVVGGGSMGLVFWITTLLFWALLVAAIVALVAWAMRKK